MLKLCLVKNKKYLSYKILPSIIKYTILFCFLLETLPSHTIHDAKKKKQQKRGNFILYYCLFLKRGKYMVDAVTVGMNWSNV